MIAMSDLKFRHKTCRGLYSAMHEIWLDNGQRAMIFLVVSLEMKHFDMYNCSLGVVLNKRLQVTGSVRDYRRCYTFVRPLRCRIESESLCGAVSTSRCTCRFQKVD